MLRQKLQRNLQEIWETFGALLKICPGALQSLIRRCILREQLVKTIDQKQTKHKRLTICGHATIIVNISSGTYDVQPKFIYVHFSRFRIKFNNPTTTFFIHFVFPHRTNAFLENRIITANFNFARRFYVIV